MDCERQARTNDNYFLFFPLYSFPALLVAFSLVLSRLSLCASVFVSLSVGISVILFCLELFIFGATLWHRRLSHIWQHRYPMITLVWVLAALFSIHLPTNAPGKTEEDGPSAWPPATHVGDPQRIPNTWLWRGPALDAVIIWWVTSRLMISLCLSFSLPKEELFMFIG